MSNASSLAAARCQAIERSGSDLSSNRQRHSVRSSISRPLKVLRTSPCCRLCHDHDKSVSRYGGGIVHHTWPKFIFSLLQDWILAVLQSKSDSCS